MKRNSLKKLDKLISKTNVHEEKKAIDYSLLKKTKQAMKSEKHNKKISISPRRLNMKSWIAIASAATCFILVLAIALPITLSKNPVEKEFFYCYNGDYEQFNLDSIDTYNLQNGTKIRFFESEQEVERISHVYHFMNTDALIDERILFLETYEEIQQFVGKKEYEFDFLKPFRELSDNAEICDRKIRYNTTFDESTYLYWTRVQFFDEDFNYRILFKLGNPNDWTELVNGLLRN